MVRRLSIGISAYRRAPRYRPAAGLEGVVRCNRSGGGSEWAAPGRSAYAGGNKKRAGPGAGDRPVSEGNPRSKIRAGDFQRLRPHGGLVIAPLAGGVQRIFRRL